MHFIVYKLNYNENKEAEITEPFNTHSSSVRSVCLHLSHELL